LIDYSHHLPAGITIIIL